MNNNWIAILSIGIPATISLLIYFLQRNKKRLSYEILQNSLIISNRQKQLDDIKITYKNEEVSNIAIVEIAIINNGNGAISKVDYENDIIINIPDNDILSAEINLCSPKSLKPEIIVNKKWVSIKPILLNADDLFVVRILLNKNYLHKLDITGRVKDIKDIVKYPGNKIGERIQWFGLGWIVITMFILIASFIFSDWGQKTSNSTGIFFSTWIIGMIIYTYGVSHKFKLSRKINNLKKNQSSTQIKND